jgi:CMP/dCMP kinase
LSETKKKRLRRKGYIVAIDGPSGAGKSTVSRQLAEALSGRLLDTGAMYRSVGYFALKAAVDSEKELQQVASKIKFRYSRDLGVLLVNGEDLGLKLRTQKVSAMASYVSQFPRVRDVLTRRQRQLAHLWSRQLPVIVEGRDIGTVVFPKVRFKFFVTASPEVRAERRYQQLKKQGSKKITYKAILKQHQTRDARDSTRKVAPLQCPKDAVVVDTSDMAINQVVHFMANHIQARTFPEK